VGPPVAVSPIWERNFEGWNSLRSKDKWPELKCISIRGTRIIVLRWVKTHAYNFFVSGPKLTNFLLDSRKTVVDNAGYRLSIYQSVPEIFAVKFESCPKSHRILNVLPSHIRRGDALKSCTRDFEHLYPFQRYSPSILKSSEIETSFTRFRPLKFFRGKPPTF